MCLRVRTHVCLCLSCKRRHICARNLLYYFGPSPLQVTYRVVQVTNEQLDAGGEGGGTISVVSAAAFPGNPQPAAQVRSSRVRRRAAPVSACPYCGRASVLSLLKSEPVVSDYTSSVSSKAVAQNTFSNGGSPAAESAGGDTRFTYFPAAAVSDGSALSIQTDQAATQAGSESLIWNFCWAQKGLLHHRSSN